jgi:hypothetical protein
VLRKFVALGGMAVVIAIVFVVGDAPSAGACSCTTAKPVMSTFVGRVTSQNGDAFSFVDVVTKSGDNVSDPVIVNIRAGRKPDANGVRMITSCDVAGDQPLIGGVYEVTIDPRFPNVGTCAGSFSLVAAPPAEMTNVAASPDPISESSDSRRPTVAIVLGVALLAIAGGMVFHERRQRTT